MLALREGTFTLIAYASDSLYAMRVVRVIPPIGAIRWNVRNPVMGIGDALRVFAVALGADGRHSETLWPIAITYGADTAVKVVAMSRSGDVVLRGVRLGVFHLIARAGSKTDTLVVTVRPHG